MAVNNCKLVSLPKFADGMGALSFAECGSHVPFEIRRIYYLYDIPKGAKRGAHAHKCLQQLIIPIHGSFVIQLDDGFARSNFSMGCPDKALYVCPMIWRDMSDFIGDAVCLVLASELYDEDDYIRNYDEFLRLARD